MKKRCLALFLTVCLIVGSVMCSVGAQQVYDTESNWIEKNEVQEQETTEEIVNQNNKSETEQNV